MPDFDLTAQGFRLPHVFTKRRRTVFFKFHGQLANRFLELAVLPLETFHLVVDAAVGEKLRSVVQQLVAPPVEHPLRDAVFIGNRPAWYILKTG